MPALGPESRAWLRATLAILLPLFGVAAASWAIWLNQAPNRSEPSQVVPEPEPIERATFENLELPAFPDAPGEGSGIAPRSEPFTIFPDRPRVEVLRYTVQEGDSVFGIAEKYRLKPETILWGNFEVLNDDPHLLQPGQELNILPVDGALYQWQAGDEIPAVAAFFSVAPEEILDWPGNSLDPIAPTINAGTWLMIPGGQRAFRQWLIPTIARGQAGVGAAFGAGGCSGDYSGGAVGGGGFIWPSANRTLSGNNYWAGHLAIDIAAGLGERVWAADAGVVVYSGWSQGGYGNLVMIDHGNGWQTVYAHLSQTAVRCGQSVGQGETIGFAGSTGNSTGSHLHFESRRDGGFINPLFVLP